MTKKITVAEAKEKLIKSITNERRTFDMGKFTTLEYDDEDENTASCGTASCMAGHIEACWPAVSKRLGKKHVDSCGFIDHEELVQEVWKEVTGQTCRFDFLGDTYPNSWEDDKFWYHATREEAVAHIKGRSKKWPLKSVK